MANTSSSGKMVRNNKKVIHTIPGAEMADAVLICYLTFPYLKLISDAFFIPICYLSWLLRNREDIILI